MASIVRQFHCVMDYLSYCTRASQKENYTAATARKFINHTTEQVVKNTFLTRRQSSHHMLSRSPSPDCTRVSSFATV